MKSRVLCLVVALTFAFGACNKDVPDQIFDEGLGADAKKAVETGFDGGLYTYGNITPPTYNSYGSDRFNNGEAWDLAFDLGKGHGKKYETKPPALGENPGYVRVWRLGNGNGPCFITFYLGISEYKCYNLAVRYAGGNNGNSGNGANGSGSTNLAWEFHTEGFDELILAGTFDDYLVVEKVEGNIIVSKQGEYITFRLDYPLMKNVDNPWFPEDGEQPKEGTDGVQLPQNVWNSEVMNPGNTHIAQINWGGPNAACGPVKFLTVTYLDWCGKVVDVFDVEAGKEFNHTIVAGYAIGWWTCNDKDQTGGNCWSEQGFMDAFGFKFKNGSPNVVSKIRWEIKGEDGTILDLTDPDNIGAVTQNLFITPYPDNVESTDPDCNPICLEKYVVYLHPGHPGPNGEQREIFTVEWDACTYPCFVTWLNENYKEQWVKEKWDNRDCKYANFAGWGYTHGNSDPLRNDVVVDCDPIFRLEGSNHNILLWALWDENCCDEIEVSFQVDGVPVEDAQIFKVCPGECIFSKITAPASDVFENLKPNCFLTGWMYNEKNLTAYNCNSDLVPNNGKIVFEAVYCCQIPVRFKNDPAFGNDFMLDYYNKCDLNIDCFGKWVSKIEKPTNWVKNQYCTFLHWEYNGKEVTANDFCGTLPPLDENGEIVLTAKYCCTCGREIGQDVVFVLDYSGSMGYRRAGDKLKNMEDTAWENIQFLLSLNNIDGSAANNRVAIVAYGGNTSSNTGVNNSGDARWYINSSGWSGARVAPNQSTTWMQSKNSSTPFIGDPLGIDRNLASQNTNAGTNIMAGMNMAYQILSGRTTDEKKDRPSVIVLMTDGSPSLYYTDWWDTSLTTDAGRGGDGMAANSSNTHAAYTILNMNHIKGLLNGAGYSGCEIYTIGFDLDHETSPTIARATINPTQPNIAEATQSSPNPIIKNLQTLLDSFCNGTTFSDYTTVDESFDSDNNVAKLSEVFKKISIRIQCPCDPNEPY